MDSIGISYRYWHCYNGEDSAKFYKQAPVETMKRKYKIDSATRFII